MNPIDLRNHAKMALRDNGYVRLKPEFFGGDHPHVAEARNEFLSAARDLEIDRHCETGSRFRRYGRGLIFPSTEQLLMLDGVYDQSSKQKIIHYYQSPEFNTEHGGSNRVFAALTDAQRNNEFLRFAILQCFRTTGWTDTEFPVHVGIHIIMLKATPAQPGISTPDEAHRDGEPYTFAALLWRDRVEGTENWITVPGVANVKPQFIGNNALIEAFTMTTPFEGWAVNDAKVAHYVSPATVEPGFEDGSRAILLIDFTRFVPEIRNDDIN